MAALSVGACSKIVGDDNYVIVAALEDADDAGLVCENGEFECQGAALQLCRDDGSGFRTVQVCSTPALCCDGAACPRVGCSLPACAAGDFRCEGPVLELCNDALTDWIPIDTCASPAQCNATLGRCTDVACSSNPQTPEYQCNGPVPEQCGAGEWAPLAACATPSLCTPTPGTQRCLSNGCLVSNMTAPSAFVCEGADLVRCNDRQTDFEHVETCANPANCDPLIGTALGTVTPEQLARYGCLEPACIAGTYQCDGAALRLCDPNRSTFGEQPEATCLTPSHCNASLGRCEPTECVPGVYQCSGSELWVCSDQRTWQSQMACPSGTRCDVATKSCAPRVCNFADHRCEGSQLSRCNVDGTGWIPVDTCATSELCNDAAKRCDEPVCELGQRRCSRDGKLQECSVGRNTWQAERDCAAEAMPPVAAGTPQISSLCDPSGSCLLQPSCTTGTSRCNGQFLERCDANAWRPQARCASASLCDATGAGSCLPAACQPGEHRCVMAGAPPVVAEPNTKVLGLTLEVCNTGGTGFVTVAECAGMVCDAAHGQCDICVSYKTLCDGDTVQRCSADGQEKELEKRCSSGCVIRAGGGAGAGGAGPLEPAAACGEDPPSPNAAN